MTNKQIAVEFIQMCALESPKKAFDKYVAPGFIHHNTHFPGDRDSLMNAMIEADKTHPNRAFEIKLAFETADRVALYSRVVKEAMEVAVVHMFRLEGGKIVEMWDVGQVVDPQSPNRNGMF